MVLKGLTGPILIGLAIFTVYSTSRAITSPTSESSGSIRPHEIRLGAYISAGGIRGAPAEAGVLDHFARMVGGQPDIVETFKTPSKALLTPVEVANLEARGQTPLVTVEPFLPGGSERTIPLRQITRGAWDSNFRDEARSAKEFPGEVMIRFAEEMNGNWYGWSGRPAAYVAAWRHVVSIFRQEGAQNVKWVWSPNVNYGDYPFYKYFPGESWVDYLGLDGYNWGTHGPGTENGRAFSISSMSPTPRSRN